MKECVKDLSKNLMSPDLEKDFGTKSSNKCRDVCGFVTVFLLVCVVAWLSALSILYQMQLTQIKSEMFELKAAIVKLQSNLSSLQNEYYPGVNEGDLASDAEDGYDLDDDRNEDVNTQLDNLDHITVVSEGEAIGDDEEGDTEDEAYNGSGDKEYWDFNMLQSSTQQGNLGKVMATKQDDEDNAKPSKFLELKKKLKEEGDANKFEADRLRRSIEESYPEIPKLYHRTTPRRTYYHNGRSDFGESLVSTLSQPKTHRTFVGAHFGGDTTLLDPDIHPNYTGNGRLKHKFGETHSKWSPSSWTSMAQNPSLPKIYHTGHVSIQESGIYFVYAQIYYSDQHDTSGWTLFRERSGSNEEALIQCTSAAITPRQESRTPLKTNSCYSAAAVHLNTGDRVVVKNTAGERDVIMSPEKSFFGLIKLAEAPGRAYRFQT